MFPRKILPDLKLHLSRRQITVITGMRRTGKTTLVNALLSEVKSKNKIYLDLQRLNNRRLFEQENYDLIVEKLVELGLNKNEKMFVGIDEIQLMPDIPGVLKYLYDNFNIKFIVTGSSSYYLKNLFSESLAGRKKIFELYPLDFEEFLTFKKAAHSTGKDFFKTSFDPVEYGRIEGYYNEFVEYGGFPEVVLAESGQDKMDLANDIISSYINVDVKTLIDFRNSANIYNLIRLLAARVGSRLDYSKLASVSGLSKPTVMDYLNLFEGTYLISRVAVFTKNRDKEIVKARKLYFCDNGLLSVLADAGSGVKFENAIFNQLRHKGKVQYFALKTGREIDFVFNGAAALEAKETPTIIDERELANLSKAAGLKQYRLVGRHASPKFKNYIWGGMIR